MSDHQGTSVGNKLFLNWTQEPVEFGGVTIPSDNPYGQRGYLPHGHAGPGNGSPFGSLRYKGQHLLPAIVEGRYHILPPEQVAALEALQLRPDVLAAYRGGIVRLSVGHEERRTLLEWLAACVAVRTAIAGGSEENLRELLGRRRVGLIPLMYLLSYPVLPSRAVTDEGGDDQDLLTGEAAVKLLDSIVAVLAEKLDTPH